MSTFRPSTPVALAVGLLLVGAGGASAQSLLGLGGLGVPLDALDARSRALGGVAVGLGEPSILPSDPAAAADLRTPGISLTFLPTTLDVESSIAESTASGSRFPLIGIGYLARSMETGVLPPATLGIGQWAAIGMMPLIAAFIAMLTARMTVFRTLAKML